jgi:hypothetical protein
MANNIESLPAYYDQSIAGELAYSDYQQRVAMTQDITDAIDRGSMVNTILAGEIQSTLVNNQIASENAIYNNTQAMIGAFHSGFSNVSRQIGEMSANMSMAFAALNTTVQQSAQAIYDQLDTMNDILNNPSLTKSRELFRRASVSYNKGFYEEARDDLLDALKSNKTDYISWFLLGKTCLFGAGEFSNVIDLDAAVDALKNAVKFITPDARKQEEARVMAAEMCFFLGLAQQTRAMDALHAKNEADCRNYLEQATGSYSQSWDYSAKMLESRYNRARCKALLGDAQGAIDDLEALVLADRNYCIKVCADNDFSGIGEEFVALIKKLKKAVFIPAKNDYERIKTLLSELASLGGTTEVNIPSTFTEELPYFDVLDYAEDFKRIIPIVAKDLAEKKAAIAKAEQEERERQARAEEEARAAKQFLKTRERAAKYKVYVAAGYEYTVGLKADGTVVAVGKNENGQCNVSGWRDIVAVTVGYYYTVGLKADSTVVAVGDNVYGQCNVSGWRDIVAVAAGVHTVGLKADGTVVAVGKNEDGQCNVSGWRDIVAVAADFWGHTVGLKADGTVVAVGKNEDGQCNVSGWRDIVAVVAGSGHTVGLKADGTVDGKGNDGECYVRGWRDIFVGTAGYHYSVNLKADSTVVAVGDVSKWRDIGPVSEEQAKKRVEDLERERLKKEKVEREARETEQEAREVEERERQRKSKEWAERLERERQAKAERDARAAKQQQWQAQGLCKYCGGKLGGLFTKKCKSCGKEN